MKNKQIIGESLMFLIFSLSALVYVHAQEDKKGVDLTHTLVRPILLRNAPLSSFISELSERTKAAVCVEDLWSGNGGSFDDMSVTFASSERESIRETLDRFQLMYPQVTWSTFGGIIILRAAALKNLVDDPLNAKAPASDINGTFDAVKSYLAAGIPGFNPAIVERKGSINHERNYAIRINSGMTVRDVLVMLTRKYGLRWHAEMRQHIDNGNGLARVALSFTEGVVPSEVRVLQ